MRLKRYIGIFEKEGDKFLGEIPLGPVDLTVLNDIFSLPEGHPMYDCYDINSDIADTLFKRGIIDRRLETKEYDYFLECSDVAEPNKTGLR